MMSILNEAPRPTFYQGSGWLKSWLARWNLEISPFGERVADLLGEASKGIYHIDWVYSETNRREWSRRSVIELCADLGGLTFDTVDGDDLTRLVFLAHDYGIRVEIRPRTFRHLTLIFHQRELRQNSMSGHPTAEQALAAHRVRYPAIEMPS